MADLGLRIADLGGHRAQSIGQRVDCRLRIEELKDWGCENSHCNQNVTANGGFSYIQYHHILW